MPRGPSSYQTKLKRVSSDFDSHQEKRLSSPGTQLKEQQDEMINKTNTLWKVVLEKLDNTPTRDISKDSMGQINVLYHDHLGDGAPLKKGIKSPSKLLSSKYQSQSSLVEQNRNSSFPKGAYFVNTITILRKEDEPKEEEIVEPNAIKDNNHNTIVEIEERARDDTKGVDEVDKESEESEEEVKKEKEEEEDDP
nr:hypothetical protein [Tanacetum cinerariifolium]